jgi:hypothetical protein
MEIDVNRWEPIEMDGNMEIDGNGNRLASMNHKQPWTVLGCTISTSRPLSLSLAIVRFLLSFAISSHEGKITNLHWDIIR